MEKIAQELFLAIRPSTDAAAEVFDRIPDLAEGELHEAFALCHDALNHLQLTLIESMYTRDRGGAA